LAELAPQTMKGIGEAYNAHDSKKVASFYTEDCVVQAYGTMEREGHGRDDVAKAAQFLFDGFSDVKTAPQRVWMKGNVIVAEIAWAGTNSADVLGIKASKKPAGQLRLHILWLNDDGLVKEQHEYGDTAGLIAQLKGSKAAPPVPAVPTNPPEMHIAKGTPDEDKLADMAKMMDDTFSKDDAKAAAAGSADDADYWLNFAGKTTKGKKDMATELTAWFKAFPDQKWAVTNAWGIDGYAIEEHTMSGTQKGPMGPVAASNKAVNNWHFVDIVQPTADGKLQHGWGYANLLEALAQTGAFKPPTEKAVAKGDAAGKGAAKGDKAAATKADAPKADAPKADAPKADAPKADSKAADANKKK
jgi:ketosteroid isomerase-like protein